MSRKNTIQSGELFESCAESSSSQRLGEGATLLHGFAIAESNDLLTSLHSIIASAPLRHMITPGGHKMSVAMTNCGAAGWVTDLHGYSYERRDPLTSKPWPSMPAIFAGLAQRAAAAGGFPEFMPDACLINRYEPGARLTLHQDKNERDFGHPIVSVSLGLSAVFLWGGMKRSDRPRRILLRSGDVAVWGGLSRLVFHGVAELADGVHPLTGNARINLTLRRAL